MTEKQSDNHSKISKVLTRRAFLPWIIVGVSGLNVAAIWGFKRSSLAQLPPKPSRGRPYFRMPSKELRNAPNLAPGFYLNTSPKSQVIHYIPEGKKPVFTRGMNPSRLQLQDPQAVAIQSLKPPASLPDLSPRIVPARASYSFERAAVSELRQNNVDKACELLLYAVQYDQQYSGIYSASIRLHDLLAGVAVRYNKPEYLERMLEVINSTRAPVSATKFADRQKKWKNPQSRWYLRWSDRSKQIEWKVDENIGLVF